MKNNPKEHYLNWEENPIPVLYPKNNNTPKEELSFFRHSTLEGIFSPEALERFRRQTKSKLYSDLGLTSKADDAYKRAVEALQKMSEAYGELIVNAPLFSMSTRETGLPEALLKARKAIDEAYYAAGGTRQGKARLDYRLSAQEICALRLSSELPLKRYKK